MANKGITIEGFLPIMLREFVGKSSRIVFWSYKVYFLCEKTDIFISVNIFQLFETMCYQFSFVKKVHFYYQNMLLYAFRTNSCNIIGGNPSMMIPLLSNQDLTPLLDRIVPKAQLYGGRRLPLEKFSTLNFF